MYTDIVRKGRPDISSPIFPSPHISSPSSSDGAAPLSDPLLRKSSVSAGSQLPVKLPVQLPVPQLNRTDDSSATLSSDQTVNLKSDINEDNPAVVPSITKSSARSRRSTNEFQFVMRSPVRDGDSGYFMVS